MGKSIEGASARATGAGTAGSASSACASEVRRHGEADDDSPALRRTPSLREPGAGQNSEPGNVQTTGQNGDQVLRSGQDRAGAAEDDSGERELPLSLPHERGGVLLYVGGERVPEEARVPVPGGADEGVHHVVP